MKGTDMRNYVCEFLKEYKYDGQSAAILLDAYDKIVAHPQANEKMNEAISIYESNYLCDFAPVFEMIDCAAVLAKVHEFTARLLMFICLSKHLRTLYIEHGLPLDYYKSSVSDLRYKMDECILVYGIVGSFVAGWFCGFFNLKRFGIGRLQFEVINFNAEYEKNGIHLTPETKVINVHIPRSGEPLTEEACREAYLAAKAFYKDEVTTEPCPFVCHSWLLDPTFEEFLPRHTNTYRFYKSFDIFESSVDRERKNLWRLFDTMEQNPEKLPTDTSMRRAFVEHLKRGGSIGAGRGVLFI